MGEVTDGLPEIAPLAGYPHDTPVAAPCRRSGSWQPETRQQATRKQVQTRETYRKGDASKAWSGILAAKSTLVSLPVPKSVNCSELHGGHRFPSRTRMPGLPIGISRGSLVPGLMASCSLDSLIGGPRPTLFSGASGGVRRCSRCCLSSLVISDLIAPDQSRVRPGIPQRLFGHGHRLAIGVLHIWSNQHKRRMFRIEMENWPSESP